MEPGNGANVVAEAVRKSLSGSVTTSVDFENGVFTVAEGGVI